MSLPERPHSQLRRIAIIGGGISGISCSWTLRHTDCIVDVYEADDRLGGHANSVPFKGNNGINVDVDTGFIAMDEATYPQFNNFLSELGIQTIPTDMSFGVSTSDGSFEWGSSSIWGFVGTLTHLLSPWFWRLVFDVLRFTLFAKDILYEELVDGNCEKISKHEEFESIGAWLKRCRYSPQFITYFLIPMVAAPWCIDPDEFARTFPAKPLIQFMFQHRLLDTAFRTLHWRSFRNGSKTYVDAFQRQLPQNHTLHLSTSVQRVTRSEHGASIELADGTTSQYDHVVLAVHANQALWLLGHGATELEKQILGAFKTSRNECYLHSDTSLLPKRRSARVAWNCLLSPSQPPNPTEYTSDFKSPASMSRISITFDMNRLQSIPLPGHPSSPGRVLVTMNPPIPPQYTQSSQIYYHPLISSDSIRMSKELWKINGVRKVSFAGAWMGFGFHEDGFASGAYVAKCLIEGREEKEVLDIVGGIQGINKKEMGLRERVGRGVVRMVQWFVQSF
ncbi:FAD/NAD(P)-binding domain-containing protein [Melanomma pulvis-pyrius CBS 109.77]|uniref:FAD/NAD(P)-binding domain-containing protein n=1 Tax=Melanomma pulvis-pyrius CBS 109.77 TaxID=1314802 RepID=A0A6A6XCK2_9PLEO|nr:FAD/NAD(P)-binding domain-containing protein [Melanomma pulvis-pyrius CBS 109.77]